MCVEPIKNEVWVPLMGCNQSPSHPWPSISQACRTVEQIQKDVHYSGSAELSIVLLEQPQELQRNRLEHLILVPLSTRISTKIQTRDGSFIHMHASIQCVPNDSLYTEGFYVQ